MKRKHIVFWGMILLLHTATWYGCSRKPEAPTLFAALGTDSTGIGFSNTLTPTADFNLFSYMYYYNGAGVGAGDFNNDGLIDLFFAANQKPSALYLNKGNLKFEDQSKAAGVASDSAWSTGVSVVDINADGLLDIYLCRVSGYKGLQGLNQLWVCTGIVNGVPHYSEQAAAYGLNFAGFSTQAAFLDFDLDGDLDMFLLNHSVNHDGNYAPREDFLGTYDSLAGQRMYRNDSHLSADGHFSPHFTDVTRNAGINSSRIGYGLGVVVSDLNLDGWPDLYVGNDFHENDYLYINNQNGSFTDQSTEKLKHSSQFSMGVDAADINNDGLTDIVSMDMLPYDDHMLRRSVAEDGYDIFRQKLAFGYSYQYARNNLQLNMGNGRYAEIGQYAGIEATDWSWSALLLDFDNDGFRDLFVSNGIPKRMNDIDYINFVAGGELQQKLRSNSLESKDLALISKFPEIKIPNQFFTNNGHWQFARLGNEIANNAPTFSNGAAYADLDNDGDLDIVVNNINDVPLIYRNHIANATDSGFAAIRLQGSKSNPNAVGAKLLCWFEQDIQIHEAFPVRGFMGSMQAPLQVGLRSGMPDSCLLIWPDNTAQPVQLEPGQMRVITYAPERAKVDYQQLRQLLQRPTGPAVTDLTAATGLAFSHRENPFNEFTREALMPYMVSTEGPALAVADINADGLEDIFIGGSKTFAASTWLQQPGGTFRRLPQPALQTDSMWEHVDAHWVDLNSDGHPDLVIATGGNEYYGKDDHLQPLLYLNDGRGNLSKKADAFPAVYTTQSKVLVHDFTGDGIVDLFIAGRAIPWQYGLVPPSFLLKNNGKGKFEDITPEWLKAPGMVTDALLADMNGDGKSDLVMCYDWGTIDVCYSGKSGLEKPQTLIAATGWWQSLQAADLNGDGKTDLLAGNFGLNNRLRASEKHPVSMYVNDFDDNGRTEQVVTYYPGNTEIPLAGKLQLEKQLPGLKKKYLYAEDFAKASLQDILGEKKLQSGKQWQVKDFSHTVVYNKGAGKFETAALPALAQLSGIRAFVPVRQANGLTDFLLLGNFSGYHVELGRQDASYGVWLQNDGQAGLKAMPLTGDVIDGEVRNALPITIGGKQAWVLAKNNAPVQMITLGN